MRKTLQLAVEALAVVLLGSVVCCPDDLFDSGLRFVSTDNTNALQEFEGERLKINLPAAGDVARPADTTRGSAIRVIPYMPNIAANESKAIPSIPNLIPGEPITTYSMPNVLTGMPYSSRYPQNPAPNAPIATKLSPKRIQNVPKPANNVQPVHYAVNSEKMNRGVYQALEALDKNTFKVPNPAGNSWRPVENKAESK